jgi:hypothetical protein
MQLVSSFLCTTALCFAMCVALGCATEASDAPKDRQAGSSQTEDDPCRSQCELAAGHCAVMAFEDFANFDETSAQWRAQCPAEVDQRFPFVVEAECADGIKILYRGSGKTTEHRYFETTGEFIALSTRTDVSKNECGGIGFWPERVTCERPVVTKSFCDVFTVGQAL